MHLCSPPPPKKKVQNNVFSLPELGLRSIGKSRFRILQSNAKSEIRFHLREIRPQGGFQLRNPNPDFMDFLFTVRLGTKKDLQNCSREQQFFFLLNS